MAAKSIRMAGWCARKKDRVVPPLVWPLVVVVGDELGDRMSDVAVAQRNQPIKAFLRDRPDESFGMRVRIRCAIGCLHDVIAAPRDSRMEKVASTGMLNYYYRAA